MELSYGRVKIGKALETDAHFLGTNDIADEFIRSAGEWHYRQSFIGRVRELDIDETLTRDA